MTVSPALTCTPATPGTLLPSTFCTETCPDRWVMVPCAQPGRVNSVPSASSRTARNVLRFCMVLVLGSSGLATHQLAAFGFVDPNDFFCRFFYGDVGNDDGLRVWGDGLFCCGFFGFIVLAGISGVGLGGVCGGCGFG